MLRSRLGFSWMTKATKKTMWGCLITIVLLVAFFSLWKFNLSRTHQHCIKNAGLTLRLFAEAHEGKFPVHTNGFGDALLLLIREDALEKWDTNNIRYITGPGDDGTMYQEALRTGANVLEEKCSRIYVQGLSESNNPDIAILFDKKSVPGGDHFRRPWGPLLREVCMLDGSMKTVREEEWAAFASNQIELLVKEGVPRATAEYYYRIR